MFKPGQSGNPNGRPKGVANKITEEIKAHFAGVLEAQLPDLQRWIQQVAQDNPEKAADLLIRLSERFLPKLTQSQITGADGEALNVEFKFGKKEDIEPTDFDIDNV
jgi:hypothetical protein